MSDLGFGGSAGVGRPFTIQDLFSAVSSPATSPTSDTTAVTVINEYLDEDSETVTIVESFTTIAMTPVGYDTGNWEDGSWS